MTFLAPGFLIALALAIPLIGIYVLKVRPRQVPVTAIFLWDRVFVEKQTSALFRKLRDLLSLLLMLAALTLLVSSAARPRLEDADNRDLLLLIDNSISMSADREGLVTLEGARSAAHDMVTGLSTGRRAAVASVSDHLEFRSLLTHDTRRLHDAIDDIEASDLPTRPGVLEPIQKADLAAANLRVILLTDGVGDRFEIPEHVEMMQLAQPADPVDNIGFAAADLVPVPGAEDMLLLFRLVSSCEESRSIEVALRQDGAIVKLMPVEVPPGVGEPMMYRVPGPTGRYQLELQSVDDALAADNRVLLVARALRPVNVAIQTQGSWFFEHAVDAFDRSAGLLRLAREAESADVCISLGAADESCGAGLHLVFAPGSESDARIETPLPRQLAADHPALQFIPVETLLFAGARRVVAPAGSAILASDASGTPLVWQHRDGERVTLVFNFDPALDEFFLSPWFPLIVHGAATHLGGRTEPVASTYPTGSAVIPPGAGPGEPVTVRGPEPVESHTIGVATREVSGTLRLEQAGYYVTTARGGEWDLAAAPLNRFESSLAGLEEAEPTLAVTRGRPIPITLGIIALIVLVAEEILYHRRKVG